jgi:hypothetical protein
VSVEVGKLQIAQHQRQQGQRQQQYGEQQARHAKGVVLS